MNKIILSTILLATLSNCSPAATESWVKPKRVVSVPVDADKALVIASSSSLLSRSGPLAGVLVEMLPRDLNDLAAGLTDVDWSKEKCLWTFDASVDEVRLKGSTLTIRFARQENTGMRFWFFDRALLQDIKAIKFE